MKWLAFLLIALLQVPASAVTGRVVRAGNDAPVSRARILLTRVDGRLGDSIVLTTDADGRFTAPAVPAGTYRLFAEHEEFVRAEAARVTVEPGVPTSSIVVRMTPTGVITGRVADASGDPVANVYVRAAMKDVSRETQTNDLGEYRLFGLPPGQYVVSAAPYLTPRIEATTVGTTNLGPMYVVPTPPSPFSRGEGRGMFSLTRLLEAGDYMHPMAISRETYARVYYPGVTDPTAVTPIDVQPGAVVGGIDLTTIVTRAR